MNTTPVQAHLFPSLPVPSQAEVMAAIQPHSEFLFRAVDDPFREFVQYRATDKNFADFTEDEAAQWLTIQATHRARGYFDGKTGVRLLTLHRKLVIVLDEKLSITIKKLTARRFRGKERVTRSNFLTRRNKEFHNQQALSDVPSIPRVMLGYLLLKELTEIKIYIAYARTRRWVVDWMSQLSVAIPTIHVPPVAATADDQVAKGFVIDHVEPAHRTGEDKATGTDSGEK